ncbi:hypothetical protein V8E54_010475 [Elaphomyces granulatus]
MYINLCVETNRYIDTNKDSNSRKDLLDFYDGMATSPEMDEANVSEEDFSEIVARSCNHREPRPRDMSVLSRFKTLGPPPPKESCRQARGRVEDEGE